jgi:hypothetical protein
MCETTYSSYGTCSKGSCACGGAGQPCCPVDSFGDNYNGSCNDPTTICTSSNTSATYECLKCGGAGEPCCAGSQCSDTTIACDTQSNVCKPCGLTDNPCCPGSKCSDSSDCCSSNRCVGTGSTCTMSSVGYSGTCAAGVCECGKEGEVCCQTGTTCSDAGDGCVYTSTNGSRCMKCGKEGQPCCTNGTACTDAGDVCNTDASSGITTMCVKCGTAGAPCCPGNSCESGGCCVYDYTSNLSTVGSYCTASAGTCSTSSSAKCSMGSCGTCGGLSQPCCTSALLGYAVCTAPNTYCSSQSAGASCMPCGGQGQPCCGSNSASVGSSTGTCSGALTCRFSATTATSTYTCQM